MRKARLDHKLLDRLVTKLGRKKALVQTNVSKFAASHAISSEAALIRLAKHNGIGTATYLKKMPAHIQQEVRETLPMIFDRNADSRIKVHGPEIHKKKGTASNRQRSNVGLAIEYLIQDSDLKDRVADLLKAKGKFDRVFREATTVLDHRIKKLSSITGQPLSVVSKAINPEPAKAILELSDEPSEQEGFFSICKGVFLAFRNTTHHELTDKFTREDALKFCGFIDSLLSAISRAKVHPDRAGK